MARLNLKPAQMEMANYLRAPDDNPPPEGIEPRRLKIYQDLIYNNIEGFISGGFPVLRSLYQDNDWHAMVRSFIDGHRCHSPYFLQISEEFLSYLSERHVVRECDPPFLLELAHYEWVELALDVSEEELPAAQAPGDLAVAQLRLSPLAMVLSYQFPVHRIGPSFQPTEAGEPTFLVVYRGVDDAVHFMEVNAPIARLLELFGDAEGAAVAAVLSTLAQEMGMAEEALREFGLEQLHMLVDKSVLLVTGPANELVEPA